MDGDAVRGMGIPEKGVVLFLELARASTSDVEALAQAVGESVSDTRELLVELSAVGLVTQDGPDAPWVPVDPVGPLRKLITEAERDMSSARSRRDELSNLEDRMSRAWGFHLEREAEDRAIEIIHGVEAANERLWQLGRQDSRLLSMNPGPRLANNELLEESIRQDLARLERGIEDRMIVDHSRLAAPGPVDPFLIALSGAGHAIRVTPKVPIRCIVNTDWAALPLTRDDDGTGGVMIVHASSIVMALEALFELVWIRAQPFAVGAPPQDPNAGSKSVLDADAGILLKLLATGLPDEAIARHLGTSPRTVRRRIKELSDQLGASSRFQLALAAARNGWLAALPPSGT